MLQLNRKRKIVLAVYFLTLVCLFSYLPVVMAQKLIPHKAYRCPEDPG